MAATEIVTIVARPAEDFSVRPLSVEVDGRGWVVSQGDFITRPMSDAACVRFLEGSGAETWEALLLMYGAPSMG